MIKINYAKNLNLTLTEKEYENLQKVRSEKESNPDQGNKFSRGIIYAILSLSYLEYTNKEIAIALNLREKSVGDIVRNRDGGYYDYFNVKFPYRNLRRANLRSHTRKFASKCNS